MQLLSSASRTTAPQVPGPYLPLDVSYAVIDIIAALRDDSAHYPHLRVAAFSARNQWLHTLAACALVSKDWHVRCQYHFGRHVWLGSTEQVRRLYNRTCSSAGTQDIAKHVVIFGSLKTYEHQPAAHLGTFAAMLVSHLPNLQRLTLFGINWRVGMIQLKCLNFLAAFWNITHLEPLDTQFIKISQFARLLSAFPNIKILVCMGISCDEQRSTLPAAHVAHC